MATDTYSTAGTFAWVCPADVYSVDAVVIGGGGGGEAPGNATGTGASTAGGQSYFVDTATVCASGGGRGEAFGPQGAFVAGDSGYDGGKGWSPTQQDGSAYSGSNHGRGGGGGAGSGGAGAWSTPDYMSTTGGAGGSGTVPGGKGGDFGGLLAGQAARHGTAPGGGGGATSVSGAGEGGYGGGSAVKAAIPVVPGSSYTVVVGAGGTGCVDQGYLGVGIYGNGGDGAAGRVVLSYVAETPRTKHGARRRPRRS